jgi:hypothetical protein
MSSKTVPLSVRVPLEDAEFVAGLQVNGATTPSDKLRAIITQARQRELGGEDFDSYLSHSMKQVAPVGRKIRVAEHGSNTHSELLKVVCEKIPELFAYVASFSAQHEHPDLDQLKEFEAHAADRLFRLIEAVLRLGVTSRAPCYDEHAISRRIEPIQDLVRVIASVNEGRKQ